MNQLNTGLNDTYSDERQRWIELLVKQYKVPSTHLVKEVSQVQVEIQDRPGTKQK